MKIIIPVLAGTAGVASVVPATLSSVLKQYPTLEEKAKKEGNCKVVKGSEDNIGELIVCLNGAGNLKDKKVQFKWFKSHWDLTSLLVDSLIFRKVTIEVQLKDSKKDSPILFFPSEELFSEKGDVLFKRGEVGNGQKLEIEKCKLEEKEANDWKLNCSQ
ncbi:hypothetical protein OVS_04290 [Mycoplasma ovis str. Michigan]|uniref:Lipoprotein n=1 Tax=Mycoplasma ovis str. Michigan TaxID=1415773 RepID=A0ABM5P2G5_9MOLU|nr:hypothetical protein [Mycoplasma ovis]AHC40585.1 hypothetical protein OVS_04290 [Mycoplasma ovis str. Michigan]